MWKNTCLGIAVALLSGCGGGGGTGAPTAAANVTLMAGQTLTLTAGETASVPAGTVVTQSGGGQITIAGDRNLFSVAAGAVLRAPTTATGPADNQVTVGTPAPVPPSANVTLLAGSATTNLQPVDGTGADAVFWGGGQIVVDNFGNLIVSDRGALRRVSATGVVTTLEAVTPHEWQALAIDAAGNVFDSTPGSGLGGSNFTADLVKRDTSGQISVPYPQWESGGYEVGWGGLAVDKAGNVYLADAGTKQIFRFAANGGGVSVLAGSGTAGNADGTGKAASFSISVSSALAIDAQGRLYLLSGSNLRMITPDGVATTIAANLPGAFGGPLAIDAAGNFYFGTSKSVQRLDTHGVVSTYATLSTNDFITSIAIDSSGNLYVGTRGVGAEIFKITP